MAKYQNKSVVITGGCSGIGYEVAKQVLMQGAKNVAVVVIVQTNRVADTLQSEYPKQSVIFIKTDISKKDQIKDAFDEIRLTVTDVEALIASTSVIRKRHDVQTAEAAASCYVEQLTTDFENGSVWIVENGHIKQVNMGSFWDSENM